MRAVNAEKSPLSKEAKAAEKISAKTLIRVGIWLLGLLIVIALGVFAVRGFGIKTVIIDQSMNPTLQNEDVVLLNKLFAKIGSPEADELQRAAVGNRCIREQSDSKRRNYRSSGGDRTDSCDGKVYIDDNRTGTDIQSMRL
ncbi:MAG: hypothetical protein ACLTDC_05705 [Lachnospiraceae bacterium]